MNIAELRAAVLRYQATSSLEHTMAEHQLRNLAAVALPALLAVAEATIGPRPISERIIHIESDIEVRETVLLSEESPLARGRLRADNREDRALAAALRNLNEKGTDDADKG